jgi:hypothetical protein
LGIEIESAVKNPGFKEKIGQPAGFRGFTIELAGRIHVSMVVVAL